MSGFAGHQSEPIKMSATPHLVKGRLALFRNGLFIWKLCTGLQTTLIVKKSNGDIYD